MRTRSTLCTALAFTCMLAITPLSIFSQQMGGIERCLTFNNPTDLSGDYAVSGTDQNGVEYTGTLKLTSWNTFTTPSKNVFKTYKMNYKFGETECEGIVVFDGQRAYYASGEGKNLKKNYYLLIMDRLQLSVEEHSGMFDRDQKQDEAYRKKNTYFKWTGDRPWWAYLSSDTQEYGFWFWSDGTWGQFATSAKEYPYADKDSSYYIMIELNSNGEFGKQGKGDLYPKGFENSGTFYVEESDGEHIVNTEWFSPGAGKNNRESAWGKGLYALAPITDDTLFVAMIGGPSSTSFGYFDISGRQFVGTWASEEIPGTGTETWDVPDDVIAKNPNMFK